ncbi:MAG: class I adenylate-forming enzyme family protein [Terrimicrobiaceae bacterium]
MTQPTPPSQQKPEPLPIPEILARGLALGPDRPALISAGVRWTWRELHERSERLAAGLLALGLEPGDRIASLMPNCPALVVHYLACFNAGFVATPLNYRYTAPEIDHALDVSQAKALLVHSERIPGLKASKPAGQLPLGKITHGVRAGDDSSYEELVRSALPTEPFPAPSPSSPAAIFFTSGSTGLPKGVTHTYQSTAWMFAVAVAGLEFTSDDLLLAGSSLSHVGAFYLTFAALSVGAGIVVPRTFDGDELLPLLRDDRPTVLSMLPSALFALTRDHNATADDFSSLRLCRAAGDKVAAELEKEFSELSGMLIDEAYGMCEVGLAAVSPPSGRIVPGSVGQAVPGVAVSIRNESGEALPPGEEGRVWIKTPAATVGYWENPDATRELFRDGWLDSGDVMKADPDGYLYFRGRKKQIIVHDGSNISPQEIEDVLLEHPAVASAGVIGIHDTVHGENVRAYITVKQGIDRPTSQDLIQFARTQVGYKAPDEIVFLEEMPQTASGKVNRTELKKMADKNIHQHGK